MKLDKPYSRKNTKNLTFEIQKSKNGKIQVPTNSKLLKIERYKFLDTNKQNKPSLCK